MKKWADKKKACIAELFSGVIKKGVISLFEIAFISLL
ncbi:hypothetical protein ALO_12054 [Acetonema longum DSM 6540]|uniref:Uncharacterized protein n=1 Tax=Acetonema longum DSM 6540 TaxID=1009370 RepID=F7NJZ9_9FIRM|nr:hypothetical protein ALO_12054 [Acetonema longum DSM 6540]